MGKPENPPFPRGGTWYDGGTIDANDLGGGQIEGMEWVFEDVHPDTGVKRTERPVRCRAVRNTSGIALLGKRLVRFEAGALEYGSRVDGYATTTAAEGYPLDEYLPTAGVPNNDICWIVIEGPAEVTTSLSNMASDVSIAGWVVSQTAATSQATTAGRVLPQLLTGATAPLADQVQNRIGRALSAVVTNSTAADLVVDVGKW